eukprot:559755-Alexandrium_andersonii.AAC.1
MGSTVSICTLAPLSPSGLPAISSGRVCVITSDSQLSGISRSAGPSREPDMLETAPRALASRPNG